VAVVVGPSAALAQGAKAQNAKKNISPSPLAYEVKPGDTLEKVAPQVFGAANENVQEL